VLFKHTGSVHKFKHTGSVHKFKHTGSVHIKLSTVVCATEPICNLSSYEVPVKHLAKPCHVTATVTGESKVTAANYSNEKLTNTPHTVLVQYNISVDLAPPVSLLQEPQILHTACSTYNNVTDFVKDGIQILILCFRAS